MKDAIHWEKISPILQNALQEDIGEGDLTTELLFPEDLSACAKIVSKTEGIVAGLPFAEKIFRFLDPEIVWSPVVSEGDSITLNQTLVTLEGKARAILTGERVALNVLQRLSGIATLTHAFVERVKGLPVKILDTRKTTPGLRLLEKYAVTIGGGHNHRFGLDDAIMIKDNHRTLAGGMEKALQTIQPKRPTGIPLEVEASNLEDVRTALNYSVDIIMLDNMSIEEMKQAVDLIQGKCIIEASGGINLETVKEIAQTGVNTISIGALTHSAKALDLSLYVYPKQ
ncbi:MAG: carboxylating nicotinate-nucleotide diphosphorylase [Calditrichaeota bacterium]|nr:MAG: carboxylating nicotinate-nucleotide diphosphorylase [Calditrichota bacterium]